MRIAIIDDGICKNEFNDDICNLKVQNGSISADNDINVFNNSHGTICAKIIQKYCKKKIELFSIRFINNEGIGSIDDLCIALNWCSSNNINIINLSNGIEKYTDYECLYKICSALYQKKVIVVAAQSNRRTDTIPANFPFVISVEQSSFKHSENPLRSSCIYANGRHRILLNGKVVHTERCNSYACAYACALIANNYEENNVILNKYARHTIAPLLINNKLSTYSIPFIFKEALTKAKDISLSSNGLIINQLSKFDKCLVVGSNCSLTKREIKDFVKHNQEQIKFLIYLKKATYPIKRICKKHGIRLWDTHIHYHKYKYYSFSSLPIIQFIIDMNEKDEYIYDFIRVFKKELLDDGYYPEFVSTIPMLVIFGVAYANEASLVNAIEQIYRSTLPDIIVIISSQRFIQSDIVLHYDKSKFVLNSNHGKHCVFYNSKELRQYIYNYYGSTTEI